MRVGIGVKGLSEKRVQGNALTCVHQELGYGFQES